MSKPPLPPPLPTPARSAKDWRLESASLSTCGTSTKVSRAAQPAVPCLPALHLAAIPSLLAQGHVHSSKFGGTKRAIGRVAQDEKTHIIRL